MMGGNEEGDGMEKDGMMSYGDNIMQQMWVK